LPDVLFLGTGLNRIGETKNSLQGWPSKTVRCGTLKISKENGKATAVDWDPLFDAVYSTRRRAAGNTVQEVLVFG
jgi:hypothetical protein